MTGINFQIPVAGPKGGPEGHVPPPPQEAMSALIFFFHVLLKEKVGAQI